MLLEIVFGAFIIYYTDEYKNLSCKIPSVQGYYTDIVSGTYFQVLELVIDPTDVEVSYIVRYIETVNVCFL